MIGFLPFGTTLTFLDLAAKAQIEEQESETFPKEFPGTDGKLWLYQNHNPGFSFGVLKEYPKVVEKIPLWVTSMLSGVWFYVCGTKGRFLKKLALTLALSGGASNLYDRYRRGYVVDYLSIRWKALKKVVFNMADVFVVSGMLLFILSELMDALREKKR